MAAQGKHMSYATPPRWAESVLRLVLTPQDRETVSGDLLEEYRDSVLPSRGERGADVWYTLAVLRYAWRTNRAWAGLMAATTISRIALDWLTPTTDFHLRSAVSTYLSAGILFSAACFAAWRTGTAWGGVVGSVAAAAFAAIFSVTGAATLLAIWHDAATLAAIRGSGGLEEALTLPFVTLAPAVILGALGGLLGSSLRPRRGRTLT